MESTISSGVRTYQGSCHCKAVRYSVNIDLSKGGSRCNCSVCSRIQQTTGIVKPADFKLLAGEQDLTAYQWAGRTGTRYFCKHCGVTCYGPGFLEQLGGDYVSVNLNTLEDVELTAIPVVHFDGRHNNWMAGPRPTPWPVGP
jgi:hypothetical protein